LRGLSGTGVEGDAILCCARTLLDRHGTYYAEQRVPKGVQEAGVPVLERHDTYHLPQRVP
jgi:hypothetical protein